MSTTLEEERGEKIKDWPGNKEGEREREKARHDRRRREAQVKSLL